jgi:aspartyl protease family protein
VNGAGEKRSWQLGSAAKHALQEALLWSGIALAGFGLIYFYDDLIGALRVEPEIASVTPAPQQDREAKIARAGFGGEVHVRADRQGHFIIDAAINGRPVTMMADTGASLVVVSFEDAERLGLAPENLDFTGLARTANGVSRIAPVMLDRVRIEGITLFYIQAAVAERGALSGNLLGMSFLSKLSRFEMKGDELVLAQ